MKRFQSTPSTTKKRGKYQVINIEESHLQLITILTVIVATLASKKPVSSRLLNEAIDISNIALDIYPKEK